MLPSKHTHFHLVFCTLSLLAFINKGTGAELTTAPSECAVAEAKVGAANEKVADSIDLNKRFQSFGNRGFQNGPYIETNGAYIETISNRNARNWMINLIKNTEEGKELQRVNGSSSLADNWADAEKVLPRKFRPFLKRFSYPKAPEFVEYLKKAEPYLIHLFELSHSIERLPEEQDSTLFTKGTRQQLINAIEAQLDYASTQENTVAPLRDFVPAKSRDKVLEMYNRLLSAPSSLPARLGHAPVDDKHLSLPLSERTPIDLESQFSRPWKISPECVTSGIFAEQIGNSKLRNSVINFITNTEEGKRLHLSNGSASLRENWEDALAALKYPRLYAGRDSHVQEAIPFFLDYLVYNQHYLIQVADLSRLIEKFELKRGYNPFSKNLKKLLLDALDEQLKTSAVGKSETVPPLESFIPEKHREKVMRLYKNVINSEKDNNLIRSVFGKKENPFQLMPSEYLISRNRYLIDDGLANPITYWAIVAFTLKNLKEKDFTNRKFVDAVFEETFGQGKPFNTKGLPMVVSEEMAKSVKATLALLAPELIQGAAFIHHSSSDTRMNLENWDDWIKHLGLSEKSKMRPAFFLQGAMLTPEQMNIETSDEFKNARKLALEYWNGTQSPKLENKTLPTASSESEAKEGLPLVKETPLVKASLPIELIEIKIPEIKPLSLSNDGLTDIHQWGVSHQMAQLNITSNLRRIQSRVTAAKKETNDLLVGQLKNILDSHEHHRNTISEDAIAQLNSSYASLMPLLSAASQTEKHGNTLIEGLKNTLNSIDGRVQELQPSATAETLNSRDEEILEAILVRRNVLRAFLKNAESVDSQAKHLKNQLSEITSRLNTLGTILGNPYLFEGATQEGLRELLTQVSEGNGGAP